jgi:small subunit ribosomal protein S21
LHWSPQGDEGNRFLCPGFDVGNASKEADLATVELRPGESQENLLKRFRKEVTNARILSDVRRKRWYISKSELRRIQKQKAIRRARRKQRQLEQRQARRRR